nr:hypothetical protein [Acidobacteriota bacterium]
PAPAPDPVLTADTDPGIAAPPPPPVTPPPAAPRPAPAPAPVPPPVSRPVAATPVAAAAGGKRSTWWIVPLVIVAIVVLAWLLLAGLPFGGRGEDREVRSSTVATETIAEGTTTNPPAQSGTVINLPGEDMPANDTIAAANTPNVDTTATTNIGAPPPATNTTPPPATTTPAPATRPAPAPTPAAPPVRTTTPPPQPRVLPRTPTPTPAPVRVSPPPAPPPPARTEPVQTGEISEGEAAGTLRGYAGAFYRDVSGSCLQIRSHGYKNVGYTFSVWDACVEGGGSRMLGRWRVDSKTREVFRQREDGRYLRP